MKKGAKHEPVSYWKLLFTNPSDTWMIVLGSIFALAGGSVTQIFSLFFGRLFNSFYESDAAAIEALGRTYIIIWISLGFGGMVFRYLSIFLWTRVVERILRVLRLKFYRSLIYQDAEFYETNASGALLTKMASNFSMLQVGLEVPPTFLGSLSSVLVGLVVSFIQGWGMTLVMMSLTPLVITSAIFQSRLVTKLTRRSVLHQSKLNGHVSETISAHKTIQSLNVHEEFISKYESYIQPLTKLHLLKGHLNGVTRGLLLFIAIASYCAGFWYAITLITSGELKAGDALSVFLSSVVAASGWVELLSVNSTIASAKGVASGILSVIKRRPNIDLRAPGSPISLDQDISFDTVKFKYPSRPTVNVLKKVSFKLEKGKTTAFVGKSGSGKSTIIKLILRIYDPAAGAIKIGDQDLKSVDLREYRSQIGYVGQEPVLFEGTVADNIRLGCSNVSLEDVIEACKLAGAHDFISQLDKGYDCLVSDLGSNLSGGQKQRIAIARALVRKPKLLLFDEASSALDTESEAHIQRTIDALARTITTVIVTHRLSSVQHADTIHVVRRGRIVETGTHEQLKQANSCYAKMLVKLQCK